jgi:hypothetical protein
MHNIFSKKSLDFGPWHLQWGVLKNPTTLPKFANITIQSNPTNIKNLGL